MITPVGARPYLPRVIDRALASALQASGAVLLEGPKACGKTFTAEQAAASAIYLDIDDAGASAIRIDPALVLSGKRPQLIDEWQVEATRVWNYVRSIVDRGGAQGQFILAGSATPDDDARRHTGAGRFSRLVMRPMSLFESGESTGAMSLAALMKGHRPSSEASPLTVPDVADLVVRGGWPLGINLSGTAVATANRDYVRTIAEVDIDRLGGPRRDPLRALRLFRALARNVAMEQKIARIADETHGDDNQSIARSTAYDYLNDFERLMVIEPQPAWSTHLRSRTRLRTAPRTHFVDPSLGAAALDATTEMFLKDLNAFGYHFESLAVRDCRIYSSLLHGHVYHYRDSSDLEIDIIIETPHGWGAFEVKLGTSQIEEAAANLTKLNEKVDTERVGDPMVLAVITATGYGYTRPDGVVVVPIGALGP